MILLALEASAGMESAALMDDDRLLAGRTWSGDRAAHARLFYDALRELLAETALSPAQIGLYAVGLGPGSFTGLRMALASAQGMALPGGKTVYGLPSAMAAAAETARETGCSHIRVFGDGRRQRVWSGLFEARGGLVEQTGGWSLEPLDALPAIMPRDGAVCTADWPLLAAPLREAAARGSGACLVERPLFPTAETVGRLALARMKHGLPSLPLSPIYLHPPVFIPPSFVVEDDVTPAQEPA
jgi:tRNA threonylcarbamoyladenosine biosynthesis protein TsaB